MIAVLFARKNSIYKTLGCDVYDESRNALTWQSLGPCIAHPPCRGWGRYRHLSNHDLSELALARFAVFAVRAYGGVLEHPRYSRLWPSMGLPAPGQEDSFGGRTLEVFQGSFGHRAVKPTWLYIRPKAPAAWGVMPSWHLYTVSNAGPVKDVEHMGRSERESTPVAFASYLIDLAIACS